jgi:O-methyltransferase domain/Dimerisation domain
MPQSPNANLLQLGMMQMLLGPWVAQSIYAAAKLGLADLLAERPHSCDELATLTHTHSRSLYRLLRGLASLGIFAETETGDFTLGLMGSYLQTDTPGSLRAMAIMLGEEHYQAWGHILHSIGTGESAFEQLYGVSIFDYYAKHPEPAKIFDRAMTGFSSAENDLVVASYDFSDLNQIVDVGGGQGSLLYAILTANPHLTGILFDVPTAIEGAKSTIEAKRLAQRCQWVGGNFFESVPAGGDAYVLKHIVHDWDDDRAIAILQQCRDAMSEGGKVLVIEQVIPPGNKPFMGKFLDLNMLVMCPGGCERTEAEYRSLFKRAGFELTRIIPTLSDTSIVEGIVQAN